MDLNIIVLIFLRNTYIVENTETPHQCDLLKCPIVLGHVFLSVAFMGQPSLDILMVK